jgi:putative lipase involved disintegration of autophagic bodies
MIPPTCFLYRYLKIMQDWIIVLGVAPFIIGMCGQVARNIVLGNKRRETDCHTGWRRIYWVTLPLHALAVGVWVGLIGYEYGLPVPAAFGDKLAGSILAYTMSGGVSVVGYDAIVKTLRRLLGSYKLPEEQRQQPAPSDPSADRTG